MIQGPLGKSRKADLHADGLLSGKQSDPACALHFPVPQYPLVKVAILSNTVVSSVFWDLKPPGPFGEETQLRLSMAVGPEPQGIP